MSVEFLVGLVAFLSGVSTGTLYAQLAGVKGVVFCHKCKQFTTPK